MIFGSRFGYTTTWTFEARWLHFLPPVLTLNNSTFLPQYMYVFVHILEQTAIIPLFNIIWLIFTARYELGL